LDVRCRRKAAPECLYCRQHVAAAKKASVQKPCGRHRAGRRGGGIRNLLQEIVACATIDFVDDTPVVTWSPNVTDGSRVYRIWGRSRSVMRTGCRMKSWSPRKFPILV
jgi:hypothetical protein